MSTRPSKTREMSTIERLERLWAVRVVRLERRVDEQDDEETWERLERASDLYLRAREDQANRRPRISRDDVRRVYENGR